jgi:PAS domain S-box-containing protein
MPIASFATHKYTLSAAAPMFVAAAADCTAPPKLGKFGGDISSWSAGMARRGQVVRKPASRRKRPPANKRAPAAVNLNSENSRLERELAAALERQTATSEVLQVISSSPGDMKPVFEAILSNALRICEAKFGHLLLYDGEGFLATHLHDVPPSYRDYWEQHGPIRPRPNTGLGRLARTKQVAHIPDLKTDSAYTEREPLRVVTVEQAGARSFLAVPMLKETKLIGAIVIYRKEVRPFTDKQIELVTNFAAQAVIAIENTRLLSDLSESLQQQTATADVLKVISRSAFDLQTVLDTLVESAARLCEAEMALIHRREGEQYRAAATFGFSPEFWAFMQAHPISPGRGSIAGRVALERHAIQIEDVAVEPEYTLSQATSLARQHTALGVPLLRENELIGVIVLARQRVELFTEKQIALVTTFADQAVIAIENVRLFDEVQAKTRDLEESLQQQTATSEVLQIISSSPGDLTPVFDKMLENATRVCGAEFGSMYLVEDDSLRQAALYNVPAALAAARTNKVFRPNPLGQMAAAIRTKQAVQVADVRTTAAYLERTPNAVELAELGGARTLVVVPMLRDDEVIGVITVYRQEVRPFDDKQIELLSNFAKQAVIAIENARLLKELRQSLQQQTATADVLKVISRSSVDLTTVLDTLVDTVARLCRADQAYMFRRRDDRYHMLAARGLTEDAKDFILAHPFAVDRGTISGRVVLERRAVHIPDVLQDPEFTYSEGQKLAGYRTILSIPLLRQDTLVGICNVTRTHVEPFTTKEIELATTFADQAVIAIENARLFEELRDRQAELRVTFDNMGDGVVMFDAAARLTAWNRNFQEMLDLPDAFLVERPNYAEYFRYLAERGEYSTDLEAELSRTMEDTSREMRLERTRPDGRVIEVRRNPVAGGGFVLIYSDITERKRAEEAIRTARDSAETALRDLQTAQDRLIQTEKLASLGQLIAGIAHEIKNPLNFVNNFSALSVELVEELDDALKPATLDNKTREETSELTQMLKGNLEKVVQHGQRADSIVKNMLLHSREGSGERRSVDLNAIVEDSLNLAYHGARAEKKEFNIQLERSFDPAAGQVDLFPQEITRVLLNLISNGVYAAMKRKAETRLDGYEPTLAAATRSLGNNVEIRIRDNGGGIAPEIRDKIFHPFFTTKPPGQGTGLGLSLSYDIVVKQHGGSIEVDTRPGEFTEFKVILPRKAALSKAGVNS